MMKPQLASRLVRAIIKNAPPETRNAWSNDLLKGIKFIDQRIYFWGNLSKFLVFLLMIVLALVGWRPFLIVSPIIIAMLVWFDLHARGRFQTSEDHLEKVASVYPRVDNLMERDHLLCFGRLEALEVLSNKEMMASFDGENLAENTPRVSQEDPSVPRRL